MVLIAATSDVATAAAAAAAEADDTTIDLRMEDNDEKLIEFGLI